MVSNNQRILLVTLNIHWERLLEGTLLFKMFQNKGCLKNNFKFVNNKFVGFGNRFHTHGGKLGLGMDKIRINLL